MAINFPSSPAIGDFYTDPNTGNRYLAAKGGNPAEWVSAANNSGGGCAGGGGAIISNPPAGAPHATSLDVNLATVQGATNGNAYIGGNLNLSGGGYWKDIEFTTVFACTGGGVGNFENYKNIYCIARTDGNANSSFGWAIGANESYTKTVDGLTMDYSMLKQGSIWGCEAYFCPNLTSITNFTTIPPTSLSQPDNIEVRFTFRDNALDQASVDGIISAAAQMLVPLNGRTYKSNSKVDVGSGTNASPSAASSANIAALTAAGFTVVTN